MGRLEKKQQTRDNIIQAGKELFFNNGYEETTTDEIAKHADIGVGTLFNYFNTKADLLIEIFSEDFVDELDEQDFHISAKERNMAVSDLIYHYLYQRMKRYVGFKKKLFRQMMGTALSAFKSNPEVMKKFVGLDFMLVDELIEYLNHLKDQGMLPKDFRSNQAAEIIYSALAFEFLFYLYQDELTMDDFLGGIQNKLTFIFR